jgi:arginine decarboxylase
VETSSQDQTRASSLFWTTPRRAVLVAASAEGPFELVAFDNALRKAGIAELNLVQVSSILPQNCELIDNSQMPYIEPGTVVPVVMSKISSSTPGQKIAAALGIAIGENSHGMVSEYHDIGVSEKTAAKTAEAMVKYMMENRGLVPKRVLSISAGHTVKAHGAALAAVVFLP